MQAEDAARGRPWILVEDTGVFEWKAWYGTVAEIARFFDVPVPHVPGDTTTPPAPGAIQIGPTDIS